MWVVPSSIRSAFFQASECLTRESTPDLSSWASEAERSCSLNGKHTRYRSWLRAQDAIRAMQARYHRTGRFGADAAALADVPPMLDFYDELLKFGSPRTMIDALEVTARRMKMQQEAA